jgi:Tfp pilus assembly protein PilV
MNRDFIQPGNVEAPSPRRSGPRVLFDVQIKRKSDQSGFTILETTIAMLIMLIVALGSASLFSFSVYNNSAGSDRATSIAIAQQALERLRSARFNATTTDASLNAGINVQAGIVRDRRKFTMTVTIIDITANLKSITVSVVPQSIGKGWAFGAGGTITLTTQRSRTDR